jgi:hypothetical protein
VLPLKWEMLDKPGSRGETIVESSEINRIATSHNVVYAVDNASGMLHRSDDGGITFSNITNALIKSYVPRYINEIAVAPDMSQYVAVVTTDRKQVYWSDDSGRTWHDITGNVDLSSGDTIKCIAVSNEYSSSNLKLHNIAIGTANWGGLTAGQVWTLQMGGFSTTWTNQDIRINGIAAVANVSAVAFSPKYKDDPWVLAVATKGTDTYLCMGDLSSSPTTWNDVPGSVVYPQLVKHELAAPNNVTSSISLPSDYVGSQQNTRIAFVRYNPDPNNGLNDVYRINDNLDPPLQRLYVGGGASIKISSIAYYGTLKSGVLLAGESDPSGDLTELQMVRVWRTLNPLDTSPVWSKATQPPSGPGSAQLAWNQKGTIAFCGTGQSPAKIYDESAFSQSYDNATSWVQTSLINTIIRMSDVAPAPDSKSLFMATFNGVGSEGVWRCAGEPLGQYWGRLLNMPSNTDRVILRLSPNYAKDYTLYAIETDNQTYLSDDISWPSNLLQISENGGNTWRKRFIPRPVIDVVAASRYTLYLATSEGCIRRSTDGGITWGDKVMTGLDKISMLAVSGNGHIFVGSMDSKVAYSTDNGTSFIEIADPIDLDAGAVQVVPDAYYTSNNIIYAADNIINSGVWRWTIGKSTKWEQIDAAITDGGTGEKISGLKVGPEGTLYALRAEMVKPGGRGRNDLYSENYTQMADTGRGGMNRTLDPVYPFPEEVEWDVINRTLTGSTIVFDPAPLKFAGNVPWLKLSGNSGENDLWAIDTFDFPKGDTTTAIYRFRDTLCKVGPWTDGPSDVGCDPVTGRNQQADLSWEQLSLSDRYDLQLAKDPAFTLRIDPAISNSDSISSVTGSIHIMTDPVNVTSPAVWLSPGSLPEAGDGYYWRIRTYHAATGEYIRSPWSDTDSFAVKPGFPVAAPYYGPQLLSPADGCDCLYNAPVSFSWSPYKQTTKYKFELSESPDMGRPLVSATVGNPAYQYTGQLKKDAAYFWRVTAMEPAPGGPSAAFSFHTAPAATAANPVTRTQSIPLWAVTGISIGIFFNVILFVLIFRKWSMFP